MNNKKFGYRPGYALPFLAAGLFALECGIALLLIPRDYFWPLVLAGGALTAFFFFFTCYRVHRFRFLEREAAAEAAAAAPPLLPGEAESFLKELREADVAILEEEISGKIRVLEERTRRLYGGAEGDPDRQKQLRRFTSYYLPTLLKLLKDYATMENVGVRGENIGRSMDEIGRALDAAAVAFDHQLDNLFGAKALDVTSDVRVLETFFNQEGLSGPPKKDDAPADSPEKAE